MNIGSVRQHDTPLQIYRRPASAFVARFLGLTNVFSARDSRIASLLDHEDGGKWRGAAWILIHPAGIRLSADGAIDALEFAATLEDAVFRGEHFDVTAVAASDLRLSFAVGELPVNVGETLTVYIMPDAIIPLDD